nr:RNA-directed DNA polymerase, eukaryota [Tanacetum cinerariifolium]
TKDSFKSHVGVNSWFSLLEQGSLLHEEEEDDSYFHRKRLCIKTSIGDNIFESFKIIVKEDVNDDALSEFSKEDSHSEADIIPEIVFKESRQSKDEPMYLPSFTSCDNSATIDSSFCGAKIHQKESSEKENGSKTCFKEDVNASETKMEHVSLFNIKSCWGNLIFDFVGSPSVGNSRGILCVWDTNMFQKENVNVSDYFIAIIGDVIVMDDFNEVRFAEERFGTIFNARGATFFNSFINSGGLVEVPTGGYSFTWSHKSAAKIREATSTMLDERLNIMNDLTSLDNNVSLELAQKAKIKWAIE